MLSLCSHRVVNTNILFDPKAFANARGKKVGFKPFAAFMYSLCLCWWESGRRELLMFLNKLKIALSWRDFTAASSCRRVRYLRHRTINMIIKTKVLATLQWTILI